MAIAAMIGARLLGPPAASQRPSRPEYGIAPPVANVRVLLLFARPPREKCGLVSLETRSTEPGAEAREHLVGLRLGVAVDDQLAAVGDPEQVPAAAVQRQSEVALRIALAQLVRRWRTGPCPGAAPLVFRARAGVSARPSSRWRCVLLMSPTVKPPLGEALRHTRLDPQRLERFGHHLRDDGDALLGADDVIPHRTASTSSAGDLEVLFRQRLGCGSGARRERVVDLVDRELRHQLDRAEALPSALRHVVEGRLYGHSRPWSTPSADR